MAIPGFFKQNKPRGFNYVPRHYDPVKEELEERRKAWSRQDTPDGTKHSRIDGEQGAEAGGQTARSTKQAHTTGQDQPYRSKIMRGDMKNYFNRRKERVQKYTMIRILVIAMIMILAIYLYLRF
ncbi:MAG: hypothetical protein U5L72_15085 [Bacteroidales bacterium]|nr:hypothetical protein [Bacteroidales bacterium]